MRRTKLYLLLVALIFIKATYGSTKNQYLYSDGQKNVVLASDNHRINNHFYHYSSYGLQSDDFIAKNRMQIEGYDFDFNRKTLNVSALSQGYTGQILDSARQMLNTGNGYRTYDPVTSSFLHADSYTSFNSIYTSNKFNYASGNPVLYGDPTGHFSLKKLYSSKHLDIKLISIGLTAVISGVVAYGAARSLIYLEDEYGTLGFAKNSIRFWYKKTFTNTMNSFLDSNIMTQVGVSQMDYSSLITSSDDIITQLFRPTEASFPNVDLIKAQAETNKNYSGFSQYYEQLFTKTTDDVGITNEYTTNDTSFVPGKEHSTLLGREIHKDYFTNPPHQT